MSSPFIELYSRGSSVNEHCLSRSRASLRSSHPNTPGDGSARSDLSALAVARLSPRGLLGWLGRTPEIGGGIDALKSLLKPALAVEVEIRAKLYTGLVSDSH